MAKRDGLIPRAGDVDSWVYEVQVQVVPHPAVVSPRGKWVHMRTYATVAAARTAAASGRAKASTMYSWRVRKVEGAIHMGMARS